MFSHYGHIFGFYQSYITSCLSVSMMFGDYCWRLKLWLPKEPGWWFQTFFIFHNIWDNPSHWLIFFRGVETTNQEHVCWLKLPNVCWRTPQVTPLVRQWPKPLMQHPVWRWHSKWCAQWVPVGQWAMVLLVQNYGMFWMVLQEQLIVWKGLVAGMNFSRRWHTVSTDHHFPKHFLLSRRKDHCKRHWDVLQPWPCDFVLKVFWMILVARDSNHQIMTY